MNWKTFAIFAVFAWACGAEEHDEPGHEGHHHGGPPPTGLTFASLALTAAGGVLVSATFLAILWKPIDTAFRRSRFRARWEQRNTRIGFAVIVTVVLAGGVGGIAYMKFEQEKHEHIDSLMDAMKPQHGGVVQESGRFAVELVARRTGEIRIYMRVLSGDSPTRWDVHATLTIPSSSGDDAKQVVPMTIAQSGEFLIATAMPFQSRRAVIHVSLTVKEEHLEVDFDSPVQD